MRWEAPWRLHLPDGPGGPAPLLVALHGKGDRAERFEREALDALPPGWALLVPEAPLPRDRSPGAPGPALGASWYLYDGDTPAFRASLDRAAEFVLSTMRRARAAARGRGSGTRPPAARGAALLGFSQGAYLAGVLAVRRPDLFGSAVLVGGRLKHEILGPCLPKARARGLRLLALHGSRDRAVLPGPAREGVDAARAAGLEAEFRLLDAAHEFTPAMRRAARSWLAAEHRHRASSSEPRAEA